MSIDNEFDGFKSSVTADYKQLESFIKSYAKLQSTDASLGYKLCQEGLVLADRWSDIALELTKEENYSQFEGSKTHLVTWANSKASLLKRMAEHSRQVWNNNERFEKESQLIERRNNEYRQSTEINKGEG